MVGPAGAEPPVPDVVLDVPPVPPPDDEVDEDDEDDEDDDVADDVAVPPVPPISLGVLLQPAALASGARATAKSSARAREVRMNAQERAELSPLSSRSAAQGTSDAGLPSTRTPIQEGEPRSSSTAWNSAP